LTVSLLGLIAEFFSTQQITNGNDRDRRDTGSA
jgi:hypothetical protein